MIGNSAANKLTEAQETTRTLLAQGYGHREAINARDRYRSEFGDHTLAGNVENPHLLGHRDYQWDREHA